MSDPVSRFRAEVGAVLLRLLEDAVLEITKVFETHSSEPQNRTDPVAPDLGSGTDRACRTDKTHGAPRHVRSVGVQAGELSGPGKSGPGSVCVCVFLFLFVFL